MKIYHIFKVVFVSILFSQTTYAADCSPADYLKARPDVVAAGMSAEVHYERHGKTEGMCRPNKNIAASVSASGSSSVGAKDCHPADYLKIRPDVVAAGMSAEVHYERHGKIEGMCRPNIAAAKSISNTNLCTPADYFIKRPDVAKSGMTAAQHYLKHGHKEGMCRPSDQAVSSSSTTSHSNSSGGGHNSGSSTTSFNNSSGDSTEIAKAIPRGRWAYIDDMVQTLNLQYPTETRKECQFSGDTNAPQDWVATLMLAASYDSFPLFMGTSATGCSSQASSAAVPGRNLGRTLSMGVPVFAGNNAKGDHTPSELSRKIVEEAKKGDFTLVVGGPFTDIWAALKSNPEIKDSLTVYGIKDWNGKSDQVAFDNLKKVLSSRLKLITNKDYINLIVDDYKEDKTAWINKLRFLPEWNKANSTDVIAHNTWHSRNYGAKAKGFRLADVILTKWYLENSYTKAVDIKEILPALEVGANILSGGNTSTSNGAEITDIPSVNSNAEYIDQAIGKTIKWNRGWDTKIGHRPKIDKNVIIKNFKVDAKYVTYSGKYIDIRHWGEQTYFNPPNHVIYAKAIVLIDRGDYAEGGAFEWSLNNQGKLGLYNITRPRVSDDQAWIKNWIPPVSGQVVWYFLMSDDERFTSNPIPFIWP